MELTELSMLESKMDDACIQHLRNLPSNTQLQTVQITDKNNTQLAQLIPVIEKLNKLKQLSITLVDLNTSQIDTLSKFLQKNQLRTFALAHCVFSSQLCAALPLNSMTKLQWLQIRNSRIEDHDAFGRCLRSTQHLQLQALRLIDTPLSLPLIDILSNTLHKMQSLNDLVLDNILPASDDVQPASSATQVVSASHPQQQEQVLEELLKAVSHCTSLKRLYLVQLHITDALVPRLGEMLNELSDVVHVNLRRNYLTSSGLNDLSTLIAQRPGKLEVLNISRNSEAPTYATIKQFKMRANYVHHD